MGLEKEGTPGNCVGLRMTRDAMSRMCEEWSQKCINLATWKSTGRQEISLVEIMSQIDGNIID